MKICPICRKKYKTETTCPNCGITLLDEKPEATKIKKNDYYKLGETQEDDYHKLGETQEDNYHKLGETQKENYYKPVEMQEESYYNPLETREETGYKHKKTEQNNSYYEQEKTQEDSNYYKKVEKTPEQSYSKKYEINQKNEGWKSEQNKNTASGDTISISKTALLGGIIAILCVALVAVSLKYLGQQNNKSPVGKAEAVKPESTTASDNNTTDTSGETTEEADNNEYNDEFPDNVVYNSDNGHHYAVYDYNDYGLYEDFDAWEQFCEDRGGYLAVIENRAENDFIYQYLRDSGLTLAFFGYTDQNSEGKWTWVNGRHSDYTNWAYGQPNNGSTTKGKKAENYAQFFKDTADGTWNDSQIAVNTYKFVCEWDY